jgi:stage II sporulation protein D
MKRGWTGVAMLAALLADANGVNVHTAGRPTAIQSPNPPDVRIGVARGRGFDIVNVPVETYVARVLGGEAVPGAPSASLEALAVAVRTYAAANLGAHRADGFDLCDQTHCQVMRTASAETERAAEATAGQVLFYAGQPATIFYSASCGGYTEVPSAVWPTIADRPFLPARPDAACGGSPAWSSELAARDLERALLAAGYRGRLQDIQVTSRTASGRAAELRLAGLTPNRISGQDLRVAIGSGLGWQHIRSTVFQLQRRGNRFRFTGHGFGHGVGMCVVGSMRSAEAGDSAATILARYFPGTVLSRFAFPSVPAGPGVQRPPPPEVTPGPTSLTRSIASGVELALPERDVALRPELTAAILQARNEMAAALGLDVPPRVAVRFHATPASYERAAGQPWFTFGAVTNGEIQLLPLDALRDRGILGRMLRRELVRLMTHDALADRPAWVRDGTALHFSDPAPDPPPRTACPRDGELLQPVSIGALSDAYSRARQCVTRQLIGGRPWRELR